VQALLGFLNVFRIKELRDRILFTLGLLAVYRIGSFIPLPGVNNQALTEFFSKDSNNLFGLYNTFVGGALQRASVFSLGIMPYISASIIIQIMGTVIPSIQALQKQGQEGRNKLNQWTRYLTILLSFFQGFGVGNWLFSQATSTGETLVVVGMSRFGFSLLAALTLTAGTMFILWLGEQISERGIGQGISLLIFAGIVARLPGGIANTLELGRTGAISPFIIVLLAVGAIARGRVGCDCGTPNATGESREGRCHGPGAIPRVGGGEATSGRADGQRRRAPGGA